MSGSVRCAISVFHMAKVSAIGLGFAMAARDLSSSTHQYDGLPTHCISAHVVTL